MKKGKTALPFSRRRISLLLLTSVFLLNSCSDGEDSSPAPNLIPERTIVLKRKSAEKVEFKQVIGKNEIQDIVEEETKYFGERVQFACPNELHFNNDSLFIMKSNNITEKYKLKWQDKKLFLHNANTGTWEYCGMKESDRKFLFNTGFYEEKSTNAQRSLTVMGQEYALTSFSELIDEDNGNKSQAIVWLKMNYVFE